MLRQHAEDLNSGPLSKLSVLIRERQHLRKTYNEQWQQLQQDLTKVGGHQEGCHNKAEQLCTRVPREAEVTNHTSSRMACVALLQLPPFHSRFKLTCYRPC